VINERHRTAMKVNNQYVQRLKDRLARFQSPPSASSCGEMIELPSHPCSSAASSIRNSPRRPRGGIRSTGSSMAALQYQASKTKTAIAA